MPPNKFPVAGMGWILFSHWPKGSHRHPWTLRVIDITNEVSFPDTECLFVEFSQGQGHSFNSSLTLCLLLQLFKDCSSSRIVSFPHWWRSVPHGRILESGTDENARRMLLTGLFCMACLVCLLIAPGPPAQGWPHAQGASTSRTNHKNVPWVCPQDNLVGACFSTEVSSTQMTLACTKLT